jgi:hypothetical protein
MIRTEIECRRPESVQNLGLFVCILQSAHFEPSAHIEKCAEGVYVCGRYLCKERSLFAQISTDLHSLRLLHTKKCAEGSKCADIPVRSAYIDLHTLVFSVQKECALRSAHIEKCAEGLCVQRSFYVCRFCLICTHSLHTLKCAEGPKCAEDFMS